MVMGGQADSLATELKTTFEAGQSLIDALAVSVRGLGSVGASDGGHRSLLANQLEVAVLDRTRGKRKFRRITGLALTELLPAAAAGGRACRVRLRRHAPARRDDRLIRLGAATPARLHVSPGAVPKGYCARPVNRCASLGDQYVARHPEFLRHHQ